jgi:hypothetical protein
MVKNFLFLTSSRLVLGSTKTSIPWVPGALSPGVKRPGHESDHSPPTSAELKKISIYTSVGIVPSPSQVVPQCEEITTIYFFIQIFND